MVNINIEIPDDVHRQMKLASVLKEMTLKEYVIDTLDRTTPDKLIR